MLANSYGGYRSLNIYLGSFCPDCRRTYDSAQFSKKPSRRLRIRICLLMEDVEICLACEMGVVRLSPDTQFRTYNSWTLVETHHK